jgi:hypothetical protein
MGAMTSAPLEGGDRCRHYGTDKRSCWADSECQRVNHSCVRKTTSPCLPLSKKACRRNRQCKMADKQCIRKAPSHMAQGYYQGRRVNILRESDDYSGHYVIEYADGTPWQDSVPMAQVMQHAASPPAPSVGFRNTDFRNTDFRNTDFRDTDLLQQAVRQVLQYKVHDESVGRPSCRQDQHGHGDAHCRQMGFGKCGSQQYPTRCNPEGARKFRQASPQLYNIRYRSGQTYQGVTDGQLFNNRVGHARSPPYGIGDTVWVAHRGQRSEAIITGRQGGKRGGRQGGQTAHSIRRWKSAAAQKCEDRCATQPGQTPTQADMKRRCYSNCRSRNQ